MKHVSVDILTGFLGSGKTTLLRHVLGGALAGEKVAVVMNELGDVGVDGRVITGLDYVESVVELNSGCICCTIDDYRFDLAVRELLEAVDPTLVLIESTGVADPEPMISRVLQAGLALDAVICVVDAGAFDRACRESQVVARQVAAADFVVINKTDLVTPGDLAALRRRLARLNGRAMLVDCERGRVSTDLMFGTSARRYRDATPRSPPATISTRTGSLRSPTKRLRSWTRRVSSGSWAACPRQSCARKDSSAWRAIPGGAFSTTPVGDTS